MALGDNNITETKPTTRKYIALCRSFMSGGGGGDCINVQLDRVIISCDIRSKEGSLTRLKQMLRIKSHLLIVLIFMRSDCLKC